MRNTKYLLASIVLFMMLIELFSLHTSTYAYLSKLSVNKPYLMVSLAQRNGYGVLLAILCCGCMVLSFAKRTK